MEDKRLEKLPEKGRAGLLWFQKFAYENEKIAAIVVGNNKNFPPSVLFLTFSLLWST